MAGGCEGWMDMADQAIWKTVHSSSRVLGIHL